MEGSLIHKNLYPLILSHLDIRSVIRCGWVNRYIRSLSLLEIERLYQRIDPWIHEMDPSRHRILWVIGSDVYAPTKPLPFYFNARRNTFRERRALNVNGEYNYYYDDTEYSYRYRFGCIGGNLKTLTYPVNGYFKLVDVTISGFPPDLHEEILYRWFALFPNERNLPINSKASSEKRQKCN
jgi:hypothetical protein